MSGWEIFTWFNVGVLVLGSVIVFAVFLRQVPQLMPRRKNDAEDADVEAHRD